MKKIKVILPLLGFCLIILWISYNIDVNQIIFSLKQTDKTYLFLAIILSVIQIFLASIRFYLFLNAANTKVRLTKCTEAVMTAIAYNSFLPSKGGDLLKAFVISQEKTKVIRITGITVVERIFDLFTIALISLIGLLLLEEYKYAITSVSLLCTLCVILLGFKKINQLPFIGKKLNSIKDLYRIFIKNWKSTILAVTTCFLIWSINLLIIILLLKSVGFNFIYFKVLAYWPFAMIAGILPLSISGFGTRDGAFLYLLENTEFTETILTATFLYTLLVYWFLSLTSLILLPFIKYNNRDKE